MPRNARHKGLLGDPDVQRWYDNHDSWKTADGRLRNLGLFCERKGVTTKALAGMEPKDYTDLLQDYLKTHPGSNVKKAVVAWLAHFGKTLQRNVKVKVVTHRDLHVPPRADVAKALDVANIRARAAIAILATSGQRPEVLASGEETPPDGLRLGDIVDQIDALVGQIVGHHVRGVAPVDDARLQLGHPWVTGASGI